MIGAHWNCLLALHLSSDWGWRYLPVESYLDYEKEGLTC